MTRQTRERESERARERERVVMLTFHDPAGVAFTRVNT